MPLKLVGLGLSAGSITLEAICKIRNCRVVYVDTYTSVWFPDIHYLALKLRSLGKEVVIARRNDLEGTAIKSLVDRAKREEICVLIPGDPLIATTHSALVVEAAKAGIDVEVGIAPSIHTAAISLSCLQVYRFGKIVTVVRPKNGVFFEYPLTVVYENRRRDLHTLMLLEIDVENRYYMTPAEALNILLEAQRRNKMDVLQLDDIIIVVEALDSDNGGVRVTTVGEALKTSFNAPPYSMIVPSKRLHPLEEECLQTVSAGKVKLSDEPRHKYLDAAIKLISSGLDVCPGN